MPHLFYRALGEVSFVDGTPEQSQDEVYQKFFEENGSYPDGIFSVDENDKIELVWANDSDEEVS